MAQLIKLKRTSVEGKAPSTSNLQLGELAINTHDGRIFFEKNDGSATIQQIVTTDSITTGSITLTGTVLGSIAATNGVVSGSSQIDVTQTTNYSSVVQTSGNQTIAGQKTFTDNLKLNDSDILIVGTGNDLQIKHVGDNTLITNTNGGFTFEQQATDRDTIFKGQTNDEYLVLHGLDEKVKTRVDLEVTGSVVATTGITGSIAATNGVISGSSQITDLTTHKETVSGATSYQVDHNLGEQYPIVQCWNTANSLQEIPNSVTTNSTNRVTVDFSTTFAGIIIVKK